MQHTSFCHRAVIDLDADDADEDAILIYRYVVGEHVCVEVLGDVGSEPFGRARRLGDGEPHEGALVVRVVESDVGHVVRDESVAARARDILVRSVVSN